MSFRFSKKKKRLFWQLILPHFELPHGKKHQKILILSVKIEKKHELELKTIQEIGIQVSNDKNSRNITCNLIFLYLPSNLKKLFHKLKSKLSLEESKQLCKINF